jgi:ligand-binding sensor domain-containing protein
VWASTESNLSRLKPDGTWEHFPAGNPFSYDVQVTDIAEDSGGAIWVATYGDSVFRYANGAWTRFDPNDPGVKLPSGYIFAVAAAPDGSVWFGTDSGAARFDGSAWQNLQVKDGLIHPRVLDVYVDGVGAVWFATSGGVSRFGP